MDKYPILIFVRGLPGSGKSSISLELSKFVNGKIIDPDMLEAKLPKSLRSERLRKFRACVRKTKGYLKEGKNVIWCQPFRKPQNIELLVNMLERKSSNTFLMDISIPLEVSWIRSKGNFHNERETFDDFVSKYSSIANSCTIPVLKLNGEDKIASNVDKILAFIRYNISNE
ncbi:ATP-binding protein [candidate division WWE3 bacterium]|uniref:ATP-binding protein n=1 Tax=candidate division WWE3 bacterium TaxID=2053526 RepID=A0A7X9HU15_UNCKA|nr:ATP-binding protein [candidate division WWE3 bacterium]